MKKTFIKFNSFSVIAMVLLNILIPFKMNNAQAASGNLLLGGTFESDVNQYWSFWQADNNDGQYDFFRSYEAPFANGSYSAAIEVHQKGSNELATLTTRKSNNSFSTEVGKKYVLSFYAKSTHNFYITFNLQNADNYSAISDYYNSNIGQQWQKYSYIVETKTTSKSLLAFVIDKLPEGATLNIDTIELFELNNTVSTKTISGNVGEKNKALIISNISNYDESDIKIQLPSYDSTTDVISHKTIHPDLVTNSGITFTMPAGTFSGMARILIRDVMVGEFEYNVLNKISEIHPTHIRLNEDMVISGQGFSPIENTTFLVVEKINTIGTREKIWLKPLSIDSGLSQARFKLPAGIASGNLYVQTSYSNSKGEDRINKSNTFPFKVKPVISSIAWSARGYENVGDKLKITGLGFGANPMVQFLDEDAKVIESIKAKVISRSETEIIEVSTTKKNTKFKIAVLTDGVLSDTEDSINYVAKPVLNKITTKQSRKLTSSGLLIPAAKISESINLSVVGLNTGVNEVGVEFQGYNKRVLVNIDKTKIASNGSFNVVVPDSVINGFVTVKVNGIYSNALPLEVIPTIVENNLQDIVPGKEMIIKANGIGGVVNLCRVSFKNGDYNVSVIPSEIQLGESVSTIKVKVPLNISSDSTTIKVHYDRWSDDGKATLSVKPHVVRASMNTDTAILTIVGYGFSLSPAENKITYKYADENKTIVTPKHRVLGVYPSNEGQMIKIQILDNYRFGSVSVSVNGQDSNEVSFGPIYITKIERRIEKIKNTNYIMGVLYISGYNFGPTGGVKVGDKWADIHYRSNFFIIAVVPQENLEDGPVLVVK